LTSAGADVSGNPGQALVVQLDRSSGSSRAPTTQQNDPAVQPVVSPGNGVAGDQGSPALVAQCYLM
jgi:hypothetical protein